MFEKICIILLVNIVYFAKTICYKYSSDDLPVFHKPPKTNGKLHKLQCWLDGRIRIEPQKDHALTTLIHAIVCVFIYLGFGKNDISFIAALLFSFNPTNNQGSVWISGRAYALAAMGMTGALSFPIVGGLFILMATYTNAGFFSPVVLLGSKYFSYFYLALPLAWFINGKRFFKNVKYKMSVEMYAEDKALKPEKIVLGIKTFGFYTLLSIIPFQNSFYHAFLQSAAGSGKEKAYSMKDRYFWLGVSFLVAMGWYVFSHPWDMVSFGLLWWCFCLAPFCNVMRMSQETAERYCYLPMIGLMVVLATVLINHPVLIAVFLAMYTTRLWFLMDMYQDDYYLLEHSCLLDPASWFVWHVRAMKRWDNQSYKEAIILWAMARIISPKEFKVNFNLATACAMAGYTKEANDWLKVAEDNVPSGQEEESAKMLTEWRAGNMAIIL